MEDRIKESFNRQGFMHTLGAEILSIEKGKVIIRCNYSEGLSQQNGYFHAGVLTSIADSACGYSAFTVMPTNSDVLSVEFKINLMKAAKCEKVLAIGKVLQAGKTLVICEAIITDVKQEVIFAKMTCTLICIQE